MIIEQDDSLTDWIKKRIVEICDAEPVAFAKYVLALLKKDSSEEKLRDICEEQLNVFLGLNTKEFVDSLFDVLNNRSYLSLSGEGDSGETALGTSQESVISNLEGKSLENSSRVQRRRISPPRDQKDDTRFRDGNRRRRSRSRSPMRRRNFNGRDRYRSHSRSRSRSPYRRDHHRRERPERNIVSSSGLSTTRIRCRDFEEKGLCRLGDSCKFYHGPDPIVLDDNNVVDFSNPPPPGVEAKRGPVTNKSNQPEAYNPEAPGIGNPVASNIPSFMPNFSVPPPPLPQQVAAMNQMGGMMPMNPYMQPNMPPMQPGFMRGFGRGRGRGRYGFSNERVQPNKSTTIEVRRIPPEVNKLGIIHKHFEQYGDITNIQISFDGSPDTALVTYAKMPDAQAAMKSQKPILDNRFIQVCWHKPPPPPSVAPAPEPKVEQDPSLANVKPVIPIMTEPKVSNEHIPTNQLSQAQQAVRRVQQLAEEKLQARRKERQLRTHLQKIHVLKTQLYEKQVTELKGVFERITKATDPKIKSQLTVMAKKLDDSLKTLSKEIHELYDQIQKTAKPSENGDEKFTKKRSLNTSDDKTAEPEASPAKKVAADSEADADLDTSNKSDPPDEQTIRKLLAHSSDESDHEEQDTQHSEIKKNEKDKKKLLENEAES